MANLQSLKKQIKIHQKNMEPWIEKRQKAYEEAQDFTVEAFKAQKIEKRIRYYNNKIKSEQKEIDILQAEINELNSNQLTIE